jgi:hypothetical protein
MRRAAARNSVTTPRLTFPLALCVCRPPLQALCVRRFGIPACCDSFGVITLVMTMAKECDEKKLPSGEHQRRSGCDVLFEVFASALCARQSGVMIKLNNLL